ncbi:7TM diverse intracellular signaling domain-containing protein [Williamwhitmania taraxaci]|nr:7TM diverse intracellular signaling domain-containing protein [Williamwhitmania taraxaci]
MATLLVQNLELIPSSEFVGQQRKFDLFQGFFQGSFWLMLLYNLLLFFIVKKRIYLYYILYVFMNSLFLLFAFNYSEMLLFSFNYRLNLGLYSFQLIGLFFYIMFLRHVFLNHCTTYTTQIDRKYFLPYSITVLFLNLLVASTLFYRVDIFITVSKLFNIMNGFVAFAGYLYFRKGSNWFVHIIMVGSVMMILGGFCSLFKDFFYIKYDYVFYEVGLLLEFIFFTYALNRQYVQAMEELICAKLVKCQLEIELAHKNEQVAYQSIQLSAKDETIAAIKAKIEEYKQIHSIDKEYLSVGVETKGYMNAIEWKEFEFRFNESHPDFYKALITQYPDLTQNEIQLCAFLKLNLNTKEIAMITQKSARSIEVMRSRIRQKMNLAREDNFSFVLTQL